MHTQGAHNTQQRVFLKIWVALCLVCCLFSGTARAGEERVTVFEGDVQASSVQVEGDTKGLVYGFQSAQGDVWVGQWPGDTEAVKVAGLPLTLVTVR